MPQGRILPKKTKTPTGKRSAKAEIMAPKTTSHIPKTPLEKKMWIQARRFVAAKTGRSTAKNIPWQMVTTVYKDQVKSGNLMHNRDIENAKPSKTMRSYGTEAKHSKQLRDAKKKYRG